MDVAAWLRGLGLERYDQAFRDNEIDEKVLSSLTAEDLKDLGVTLVGHRRRLLDAIAALGAAVATAAASATVGAAGPGTPVQSGAERRQLPRGTKLDKMRRPLAAAVADIALLPR